MNSLSNDLKILFNRDLDAIVENLEAIPEAKLWESPEGVTNSCGILVQHLVGNLNHFIGHGIGDTGYMRDREKEFSNTGIPKEELIDRIHSLQDMLDTIFSAEEGRLDKDFSLNVPFGKTKRGALIHLYGHLNYHLGQLNYLRRIISKNR
ncbi:DinB family protein [Fodinibius halophilus]|uniref:DinB family protein n=1 Tax=Fodinibius halophilus TaxID=1736908 RepID=A0A6M1T5S8_9BACT|nr:DinB family protein [Fodinibius halophilus]NGP88003.1 DinB family protein [Fodinibius halophilus]